MNRNPLFHLAETVYRLIIKIATSLQSVFLLIIRLYWGWQFFESGKGKLGDITKVTGFFESLHIPFPELNAYLAGCTECFGGLLLLVGIASRLITLPLIFTMIIAYITASPELVKGIFSAPDDFVTAAPFLFMLAATIVFLFGPGIFSVDGLIGHLRKQRAGTENMAV